MQSKQSSLCHPTMQAYEAAWVLTNKFTLCLAWLRGNCSHCAREGEEHHQAKSHYDEVNHRSSVLDTRTLNIISEWNPSHAITKTAFQWDSFLLHQFNSREMWSHFPPIKGQYMTCLSFIPITKWRKKNRGSGPNEPRFRRYSAIKAAICNLAIATSAMFLDAK